MWSPSTTGGEEPGAYPMDTHGPLASSILEDVNTVKWIGVHRTHDPPWIVSADWDQAKIERPSEISNLLESRTVRVIVLGSIVIDVFR